MSTAIKTVQAIRRSRNPQPPFEVGDRVTTTSNNHARPINGVIKDTCPHYGLLVVNEQRNPIVGGWFKASEVRHV